jgi:hypothetical protein
MDISGISGTKAARGAEAVGKVAPRRPAPGDKDFKSLLSVDDTDEAAAAGGIGGVSALDALLFAQETGDAMAGRQKNKKRASQMLDKLDELKMEILTGAVSRDKLESLAQMIEQERTPMDDPELSGIMDEIDLRAAVELAKLGV